MNNPVIPKNPADIPLVARTLLDGLHEMERHGVMDHLDCWDESTRAYYEPKEKLAELIRSAFVKKPWGSYQDLFRSPTVVAKRITVDPGEMLSLQRHQKRDEFWVVQSGVLTYEFGGSWTTPTTTQPHIYEVGEQVYVLKRCWHRAINGTDKPLVFLELQFGECDEDDIERYNDKYGRPVLGSPQDAAAADTGAVVRK